MKIENASQMPKVYFGLHCVEGTAEYREPDKDPYRIYVGEDVLKQMDPTFAGKPVYVDHVDEVNVEKIHEADGYVIESFYNKSDGKHWAKFIIVSDRGHEALKKGWQLSNAYIPMAFTSGGLCHGVEYEKEVTMAEYEHLAIVENPRYEESIVLTQEQFKSYNSNKELELLKVANSIKGETEMKFNIFKRAKVENAADIEGMSVTLPKSKVDKTLAECIELADTIQNMNGYANGDHMVKVGEDEMSVNDLASKYCDMKKSAMEEYEKKKNADDEEKKKENGDEKEGDLQKKAASETELALAKKKDNEDPGMDMENKKKNEEEEKMKEEKKKNALHFEALKNAPNTVIKDTPKFELSEDKVVRGKARYGSN